MQQVAQQPDTDQDVTCKKACNLDLPVSCMPIFNRQLQQCLGVAGPSQDSITSSSCVSCVSLAAGYGGSLDLPFRKQVQTQGVES